MVPTDRSWLCEVHFQEFVGDVGRAAETSRGSCEFCRRDLYIYRGLRRTDSENLSNILKRVLKLG